MIHSQNEKIANLFKPQSVATNGTATGTVSCTGFRYAKVVLKLDTAASTSNTDVAVTLTEGDGTTFASATDLSMTTVTPDTSNQQYYVWFLDLRKRKKNLKISYSPSASGARLASADITFSRAEQPPTTATTRGVSGQVIA